MLKILKDQKWVLVDDSNLDKVDIGIQVMKLHVSKINVKSSLGVPKPTVTTKLPLAMWFLKREMM